LPHGLQDHQAAAATRAASCADRSDSGMMCAAALHSQNTI
jgi:hypothetical protein